MTALLPLLLLLACDGSKDDEDVRTETACPDPVARILTPAEGDRYTVGDVVELSGEATGITPVRVMWGVDGDVVGLGTSVDWTADAPGERRLTLQVEDACGAVQTTLKITVVAAEDSGGNDSGGDTASVTPEP
jgi:hypothetical protein